MAYTTIKKPSNYFDTRTYSASGAGSISDLNFQPDFIWFKNRTIAGDHGLFDAIRGVTKYLISSSTSTGLTGNGTSSDFLSFDTNGFSYGTSSQLDVGAGTPVTWCWKANGSGSSNTDGSITSTVSANTTSGFSIVSYAGSNSNITVGHGLGAVPKLIFIKNLSSVSSWTVYHNRLGASNRLILNSSAAQESTNQFSFGTSPTSSVFSLGGGYNDVCASGQNYVAYCFSEVKGFSRFGSYIGRGSNLPFIYTGFKPAFVIWKGVAGESWGLVDNKRNLYNSTTQHIYPNLNDAEATQPPIMDFLSNGFKLRWTDSNINFSGNQYIYIAFAEEPLVGDNPATAR